MCILLFLVSFHTTIEIYLFLKNFLWNFSGTLLNFRLEEKGSQDVGLGLEQVLLELIR